MRTSSGDTPGFVDRVASLQTRVLELEAQLERGGSSVSQLGTSVSGRPTLTSHVIPLHTLTEDSETGLVHACCRSKSCYVACRWLTAMCTAHELIMETTIWEAQ
jgi:hypothetical protein